MHNPYFFHDEQEGGRRAVLSWTENRNLLLQKLRYLAGDARGGTLQISGAGAERCAILLFRGGLIKVATLHASLKEVREHLQHLNQSGELHQYPEILFDELTEFFSDTKGDDLHEQQN